MSEPVVKVLDALRAAGCNPRPNGQGWTARCPAHDDRNPSLSVDAGDNGAVLIHCHAGCCFADVLAALELKPRDLFPDNGQARGKAAVTARRIVADFDGKTAAKPDPDGIRTAPVVAVGLD